MDARFVTVTVGPGQRDAMIALADVNYHFTRLALRLACRSCLPAQGRKVSKDD
jgi:hypothetical protein